MLVLYFYLYNLWIKADTVWKTFLHLWMNLHFIGASQWISQLWCLSCRGGNKVWHHVLNQIIMQRPTKWLFTWHDLVSCLVQSQMDSTEYRGSLLTLESFLQMCCVQFSLALSLCMQCDSIYVTLLDNCLRFSPCLQCSTVYLSLCLFCLCGCLCWPGRSSPGSTLLSAISLSPVKVCSPLSHQFITV